MKQKNKFLPGDLVTATTLRSTCNEIINGFGIVIATSHRKIDGELYFYNCVHWTIQPLKFGNVDGLFTKWSESNLRMIQ